MDRLNVHRSAVRKLHQRGVKWLDVEWLPGYAPDLNPVEALWSHAKYSKLANFVPADFDRLHDAVAEALDEIHFRTSLLPSFFKPLSSHYQWLIRRAMKSNARTC